MFRPGLDEQVVQILQRLLAKQPAQRYQRPSELIGQLLVAAERLNMQAIARNGSIWVAPRRTALAMFEEALPWALPIALFVIIALVLNGFWTSSEPFDFDATPIQLQPAAILERPTEDAEPSGAAERVPEMGESASVDAQERPATEPKSEPETLDDGSHTEDPATPSTGLPPETVPSEGELVKTAVAGSGADEDIEAPPGNAKSAASPDNAAKTMAGSPSDLVSSTAAESPSASALPATQPPAETPLSEKPPVVAPKVTKIVVSDQSDGWGPDVLTVPTLAEACRDARQLGATRIELHFDGPREESPFEITAGELTICSGSGYRPLIVFRPQDGARDSAMIRASGSKLVWQNIQILFDLTEAPPGAWALFRLRSFVGLELQDAALTIRNVDRDGAMIHPRVDFFVVEPRTAAASPNEKTAVPIPYYLSLSDAVVRGQATVVRAEQATPFRLFVQNGLIVTRTRLVDVEGSRSKPSLKDGRVDVQLRHVTAVLGEGIIRMASDDQTPHQLDLHTDFGDSILYVTSSAAVLFERMGLSDVESVESRLDLRGRDNFYPGSTHLLRLGPDPGEIEMREFDFDSRDQLPFLEEKSPNFMLMWKGIPGPGLSEDRHDPAQYELERSDFNPAIRMDGQPPAGAVLEDLPSLRSIPAETALDPTADAAE